MSLCLWLLHSCMPNRPVTPWHSVTCHLTVILAWTFTLSNYFLCLYLTPTNLSSVKPLESRDDSVKALQVLPILLSEKAEVLTMAHSPPQRVVFSLCSSSLANVPFIPYCSHFALQSFPGTEQVPCSLSRLEMYVSPAWALFHLTSSSIISSTIFSSTFKCQLGPFHLK